MACGPVWEGICFATMDQYKTLWDGEYRGGLPLIFNFMNNLYGMGGQTMGETMGYGILARVGAGVNPEMMHAERVDGYNPLAVIDAFRRKRKFLKKKKDRFCLIPLHTGSADILLPMLLHTDQKKRLKHGKKKIRSSLSEICSLKQELQSRDKLDEHKNMKQQNCYRY